LEDVVLWEDDESWEDEMSVDGVDEFDSVLIFILGLSTYPVVLCFSLWHELFFTIQ
jgi:hypothetical protein